ncbi:MAG TPA: ABC transporter permease [Solirubrobacterales bacterium]|nr:ABC transporter permease [Solirubrobacterales bacterium]
MEATAIRTIPPEDSARLQRIDGQSSRRWRPPRLLRRAIGPLLFLLLWQVLCSTGVLDSNVMVEPSTVVSTFRQLIGNGELGSAIGISLKRVAIGALIGISLGVIFGSLAGLSRLGEDLIDSTMQMLRTIPFVAMIPLFIVWFGIGETPKYALIALGTMFPVYLNVYAGIRGVDSDLIECARSLGIRTRTMIPQVVLPAALPNFFVGLRFSLGIAWIALIFAEQINTSSGIGFLLNNAEQYGQTNVIVVCLVTYAVLGLTIDIFVRLLEHRLLAWRPSFGGR